MKKAFLSLVAIIVLFSSCSTIQRSTTVVYNDYSIFTQNGIYVTELPYVNFDYEALGNITISMMDGTVKKEPTPTKKGADDVYVGNLSKWQWSEVSYEEIYQSVCDIIKEKGGNGLVNLKYSVIPKDKKTNQGGIIVSGMVIRK